MNTKVEKFLNEARAKKLENLRNEKDQILVSIGLCEKEKVYSEDSRHITNDYPYWDNEKKQYYGYKKTPVEVSDEEYNEILEYITCKENSEPHENNTAESTIKTVATIILIFGIISSILCFFTLSFQKLPREHYSFTEDTVFNPSGLVIAITVLLTSIATWAIMKVLANISITLKKIDSKQ